jgi:hypothetical protein
VGRSKAADARDVLSVEQAVWPSMLPVKAVGHQQDDMVSLLQQVPLEDCLQLMTGFSRGSCH